MLIPTDLLPQLSPPSKPAPTPLAGKQVFTHMSLWRAVLIQTQDKVKTFQSFAGRQFTNSFIQARVNGNWKMCQ